MPLNESVHFKQQNRFYFSYIYIITHIILFFKCFIEKFSIYLCYNIIGDDMNNRENFVYRIMQLQKQNNLNDHELSRLLGYKANNMNKIINFVSLPRMEKFFELCDFFNISPEEFFRYNDEDPKWTDQTFKRLQNLNEEERKIIDYILTTFENNKK